MEKKTELERRKILRLSNEESNRITRECIQTALIKLLGKKTIDKITISELTQKAGVSRTAFYRNYTSKEEVLNDYSAELILELDQISIQTVTADNPKKLFQKLFRSLRERADEIRVFIQADLFRMMEKDVREFLPERFGFSDSRVLFIFQGWASMLLNIVLNWYLNGMKESDTSMAELCSGLLEKILQQIEEINR